MALFGFLNLNKPTRWTSRQVVDRVERLVAPDKLGHGGTLDPLATGVLVLAVGQATRLVEYLHELPKSYRATFLLGRASDTWDTDGQVVELPAAEPPSRAQLDHAAQLLTGRIEQLPPIFSALKVGGQRAYTLARKGQAVELAPRMIEIMQLAISDYEYPELQVDVTCSSGTYIRSLGRDLAELAGTSAVMSALERTAIGPFAIAAAIAPADLTPADLPQALLPATVVIDLVMPRQAIGEVEARRIAHGQRLAIEAPAETTRLAAVDGGGRLLAILARRGNAEFAPEKVFLAS